jgi:hypothetical protein
LNWIVRSFQRKKRKKIFLDLNPREEREKDPDQIAGVEEPGLSDSGFVFSFFLHL